MKEKDSGDSANGPIDPPQTNLENEIIQINEVNYPVWVIRRAEKLVEKFGVPLDIAMRSVVRVHQAKENSKKADHNEPSRAIIFPRPS